MVCERPCVQPPDYSLPFVFDTDASDVGMRGVLYQGEGTSRKVLRYLRKVIDMAVYYREAYSVVWCLTQCKAYLDSSPFQVVVRCDHCPLKYVKTSRRGPLANWKAGDLAGVDWKVEYLAGPLNVAADCLTRYPLVGPGVP